MCGLVLRGVFSSKPRLSAVAHRGFLCRCVCQLLGLGVFLLLWRGERLLCRSWGCVFDPRS